MRSILVSGVGGCALMLSMHASMAQTAPPSATKPDDTALETVVVTAQRRSEDIQTVPISIQAFSGKQIDELGVKTSSDIGQFASNVEIALPSGSGNQPLISIRGIGLNDFDTNNAGPNGVYLDEVYLSAPASQTFSVFDLQGLEVLKGPQGTLYGRNASGGAINIVSMKPSDEYSANVHLDYGSYNTANLEGAVGGQIVNDLDGRVAFSYNRSDGYMHNLLTGDNENGLNQISARGALLFKPLEGLNILLNVHGGQINNRPTEYRHIGDQTAPFGTGTLCSNAQNYGGQCVDFFGYGTPAHFYDGAFNRQQHLRVTNAGSYLRIDYAAGILDLTSITAIEYNMKLHPEDSDASPSRLLEINYGVHSATISQEFRAGQTRDSYNWVAGLYYLHENLAQNQPLFALLDGDAIAGAPGAFDGFAFQAFDTSNQLTDAYALFSQGDYKVTDKFKITLGARLTEEHKTFDYNAAYQLQQGGEDNFGPLIPVIAGGGDTHEYLSNDNFSWRFALNYNFTPDILAYGSIATGFKSGDFNGSFLSMDQAEALRQLQPVQPEKVKAYEVGIKSSFLDRRLIVNAAIFYNDYREQQVFVLIPPVAGGTGLSLDVLDNAPKSHTEGIDFDMSYKPFTNFTTSVQIGALKTRIDQYLVTRIPGTPDYSGNQLPLAPHISGSVQLDYKVPLPAGALEFQANANYKGHVFFDVANNENPSIQQSGYWLENARVAYGVPGGHWEAAVFVHNLSDKEYYNDKFDLSSPFGFIEGIVGQPRMFGAEVNWRY